MVSIISLVSLFEIFRWSIMPALCFICESYGSEFEQTGQAYEVTTYILDERHMGRLRSILTDNLQRIMHQ